LKAAILPFCDAVVVPNTKAKKKMQSLGYRGNIYVIHHHWDPRLRDLDVRVDSNIPLNVGYVGDYGSMSAGLEDAYALANRGVKIVDTASGTDVTAKFLREKKPIPLPQVADNMERVAKHNINLHVSIRPIDSNRANYKPDVKLATAAALSANIVTTPDASAMELLPIDYPYIAKDSELQTVVDTIQYARDTYGTDVWKKALQDMEHIKQATSIDAIARDYLAMFRSLGIVADKSQYSKKN
jgi:hypothetical protein